MAENNILFRGNQFRDYPYLNTANDALFVLPAMTDYIDCAILANSVSTYGVDLNSIEVMSVSMSGPLPKWIPGTSRLRVYRPTTVGPALQMNITYRFRDVIGRLSNIARAYIDFGTRAKSYIVDVTTKTCQMTGFGQNTGYSYYAKLIQIYTATGAFVLPKVTKDNISSDPDYVAPVVDIISCPTPTTPQIPFTITNNGIYIIIDSVTLQRTSLPDITIPVTVGVNATQVIPIPIYNYSSIIVNYTKQPLQTAIGKHWRLFLVGPPNALVRQANLANDTTVNIGAVNPPLAGILLGFDA